MAGSVTGPRIAAARARNRVARLDRPSGSIAITVPAAGICARSGSNGRMLGAGPGGGTGAASRGISPQADSKAMLQRERVFSILAHMSTTARTLAAQGCAGKAGYSAALGALHSGLPNFASQACTVQARICTSRRGLFMS